MEVPRPPYLFFYYFMKTDVADKIFKYNNLLPSHESDISTTKELGLYLVFLSPPLIMNNLTYVEALAQEVTQIF